MDAIRTPPDAEPLTLADAAVRLGISPDAARKRLERGTLRGEKHGGRWRVYLEPDTPASTVQDAAPDATRTVSDAAVDTPPAAVRELLETLRAENQFLRDELAVRTEEIRRRDHIIAGLVERVKELPATVDVPQERVPGPPRGDQSAHDHEPTTMPAPSTERAWRRWWRRVTRVDPQS